MSGPAGERAGHTRPPSAMIVRATRAIEAGNWERLAHPCGLVRHRR